MARTKSFKTWAEAGMSVEELVEEYVGQRKSISQICHERHISPGGNGAGLMATELRRAGHTIRDPHAESAEKRRVTKDNLYDRWGIGWEELVGWYNARKPLSALCGKYGYSPQRSSVLKRLLEENGILTDDPLRGFGFSQDELMRMYVEDGLSVLAIRAKFGLSRHAGVVMISLLRDAGVRVRGGWGRKTGNTTWTSADGYTRCIVNEDNRHLTHTRVGGSELEHRLVVAESIGRPLRRDEWVHHINRDKADNRLSNLLLVDKTGHKRIHTSMDGVIEELFKEGMVVVTSGYEYKLKDSDEYMRGFGDALEAMLESE